MIQGGDVSPPPPPIPTQSEAEAIIAQDVEKLTAPSFSNNDDRFVGMTGAEILHDLFHFGEKYVTMIKERKK